METRTGYVTEEEFWARYGDTKHRVELDDGEVVPKYGIHGPMSPTGGAHGIIVGNLVFSLESFVRPRGLGRVFTDPTAFVISEEPRRIRCPDVALVRSGRLPDEIPFTSAPLRVAPDLAAEVVSLSEPALRVDAKIDQYLEGGVRLVWKVDAKRRLVTAYDVTGGVSRLRSGDSLDGGDVLPGFTCPLAALFAGVAEP